MKRELAVEEMKHIAELKENMSQFEYLNKNLRVLYYKYYEKSKINAKDYIIDLITRYIEVNKIKIDVAEFITKVEEEIENFSKVYELYLLNIFENIRISASNQYINTTKMIGYYEKSKADSKYDKNIVACAQKILDYSVVDIESRNKIFSICDDLYESIIIFFEIEEIMLDTYKKGFIRTIIKRIKNSFESQNSKQELLNQKFEEFRKNIQNKVEQVEDQMDTYNAQMKIVIDQINNIYNEQINT